MDSSLLVLEESLLPEDQNDITSHDLIEAYNVLFYKLKSSNAGFSMTQARVLTACLQRDMHESSEHALLPIVIHVFSRVLASAEVVAMISEDNLTSMYSALLSLYHADLGSTVRMLVMFTLSVSLTSRSSTFPQFVLRSTGSQLMHTLCAMLTSRSLAGDGLKLVEVLARKYPADALQLLAAASFIPTMLQQLVKNEELLPSVAATLSAIANAKLLAETPQTNQALTTQLYDFMTSTLAQRSQSPFSHMTTRSLQLEDDTRDHALQMIASMIVLHDYHLYHHAPCLRYYFRAHSTAFALCKQGTTANCYRSLVWAYSRHPLTNVKEASTFKVVLQETREGIGTALACAVLWKDQGDPERALEVVEAMLSSDHGSIVTEGLYVLERMLGNKAEPMEAGDAALLLHRPFFDGGAGSRATCLITSVSPLHTASIEAHWETILRLWVLCARRACTLDSSLPITALNHVLQVLLLSPSELTQRNGHLTTNLFVLNRLADLLCEFLPMSLSLAAASWGVATRVFGDISLNYIGQQVTKAFLQLPPEHAMSSLGKKLLGSLVSSVDEPVMLNLMRTLNPDRKIQRVVWFCLSKACVSAVKAEHDASHRLQLIALPIRVWPLDDTDLGVWLELATSTLHQADWTDCMNELVLHLGDHAVLHLHANIQIIPALLSFTKPHLSHLPTGFLSAVSSAVTYVYPPTPQPDTTSSALRIFSALLLLFKDLPSNLVVPFLASMSLCLETWFNDTAGCVPANDYNTILMEFYTTILTRLSAHPPSEYLMSIISPILSSVFKTMPEPRIGPKAFKVFWEKGWKGEEKMYYAAVGDGLRDVLQVLWCDGVWDTVPGSEGEDSEDEILQCSRPVKKSGNDDGGVSTSSARSVRTPKRWRPGQRGYDTTFEASSPSVHHLARRKEEDLNYEPRKRRRTVKTTSASQAAYETTVEDSPPFKLAHAASSPFKPKVTTDPPIKPVFPVAASPFTPYPSRKRGGSSKQGSVQKMRRTTTAESATYEEEGPGSPFKYTSSPVKPTVSVSVSMSGTNVTTPNSTPPPRKLAARRRRSSQRFAFSAMTAITSPQNTMRMDPVLEDEDGRDILLQEDTLPASNPEGSPGLNRDLLPESDGEMDYDTWEAPVTARELRRIRDQVSREEQVNWEEEGEEEEEDEDEDEEDRHEPPPGAQVTMLSSPFTLPLLIKNTHVHGEFATPPNKKADGVTAGLAFIEQGVEVFENMDSSLVMESPDLNKYKGLIETMTRRVAKAEAKKKAKQGDGSK